MKLDPNCIRDILLYLEENLSMSDTLEMLPVTLQNLTDNISFSRPELANTLLVLDEAGFIEVDIDYADNSISELWISRITYIGYQFIESIRPDPVWKKVLHIGSHIGSFSIEAITTIASNVLTELIQSQLRLM